MQTTYEPPVVDVVQLRRYAADFRNIEDLLPILDQNAREAVAAWRVQREAAVAAAARLRGLLSDHAWAEAVKADATAQAEAIARGDFAPTSSHRDALAAARSAAAIEAEHVAEQAGEARGRVHELLLSDVAPLVPLDPATIKSVVAALDKLAGLVPALDARAGWSGYIDGVRVAMRRSTDAPPPNLAAGPGALAVADLRALLAQAAGQ